MGFSHSAYLAYGVLVPVSPYSYDENDLNTGEQVDEALSVPTVKAACPDVRHLEAGDYDEDKFFLVTECFSASHEPTWIDYTGVEEIVEWGSQLQTAIEAMGWQGLVSANDARWFVIADVS